MIWFENLNEIWFKIPTVQINFKFIKILAPLFPVDHCSLSWQGNLIAPRSKLQFCCQMELKHLRNNFCMNEIENLCAYLTIFLFHKMEPQNHKAYHIAGENNSCIFDCKIWCLFLQLVSVWFWRLLFGGSKLAKIHHQNECAQGFFLYWCNGL